ncbi:MAG: mechanosensitive ion channel family protein [Bacteroidota bacterium]
MSTPRYSPSYILIPLLILSVFVALATLSESLIPNFGVHFVAQARVVVALAVQVGIWLSAGWMLIRCINFFLWDRIVARSIGGRVPGLLKTITAFAIGSIAVAGVVGVVFDLPVMGFFATSGVVGLVLGFALRNMIQDVFTGVAVNLDRSFAINDWITVHSKEGDVTGQVTEINWRTTYIKTESNSIVILPNSSLGLLTVTNHWSSGKESRFEVKFCLDFSVPPRRAQRVIVGGVKAIAGRHGILESPEPAVLLGGTSELGVEYIARYWIKAWENTSPTTARHHVISSVMEHLQQSGLSLAYPKEDVYYERMPARQLDAGSLTDREKLLATFPLFKILGPEDITFLGGRMREHHHRKGDVLFKKGDEGSSMHVLFEGLLHVHVNGSLDEKHVAQYEPGQFFGEVSLLTGDVREATLVAATESVTYEITKTDMELLFEKRPNLIEALAAALVDRQMDIHETVQKALHAEVKTEQHRSRSSQMLTKMRSMFRGVFKSEPVNTPQ